MGDDYRLDWKGWTFWQFPFCLLEFPIDFLSKDRGMWLASEWKKGEVVVLLSYTIFEATAADILDRISGRIPKGSSSFSPGTPQGRKSIWKSQNQTFLIFFIFQEKIWKYLNFRAKMMRGNCQSHLYFGMEKKIRLDISRTRFFSIHAKLQFWALARCLKITKKVSCIIFEKLKLAVKQCCQTSH